MSYGYGRGYRRHVFLRHGTRRGAYIQQARQVVAQPTAGIASPFAGLFSSPVVAARHVATPAVRTGGGAQVGRASFYSGPGRTASGGRVGALTCAHRWLPFGTRVLITNLANARQTVLTVNDRGPFVGGRIVDVSRGAAGVLGMLHSGTAPVRLQVVGARG